jgi:hypothetical protein
MESVPRVLVLMESVLMESVQKALVLMESVQTASGPRVWAWKVWAQ